MFLKTKQQTIDGLRALADKLEQATDVGDGFSVEVHHHPTNDDPNPLAILDVADEWDEEHRRSNGSNWTNFDAAGISCHLFFNPTILPGSLTDNRMSLADFYKSRKGVAMEQ